MSRVVLPPHPSAIANLNFSRTRLLLVDDNALARDVLDFALSEFNITQIYGAESAIDGLVKLPAVCPDLILVDWMMEPMDGLSFVREVRGDRSSPLRYVPIIMVTAYSEQWRVTVARDAGVNEFIVKPFTAKTLFAKIRATVEAPRAFVEVPGGYFGPDRRRRGIPVAVERRTQAAPAPLRDRVPSDGTIGPSLT